ncbi:hypothetical protein AGMMS49942_01250 [Spirochaetia bacterium]|nr:hypothetical protein AGMMS49942_01250 [Spirochaetia bacterium]
MTRGILIAGNESTLSAALALEAGKRVERFCAAFVPNHLQTTPPAANRQGPIPLAWNPGSPVSARTLALAAENQLGQITEAILICTPPAVRKNAADLNPANIEIIVNDYIKGWFFLVKELASVFKARKAGALALVLADTSGGGGRDDPDLIGPSVAASFHAFAQALMASSQTEPYDVYGFAVPTGDDTNAGAFVFKTLEDSKRNAGKWHKFGSRLPFLGR